MSTAGRPKGSGIKVTPDKEREILAVLSIGGSRQDAADYVGVGRTSLLRAIDRDEAFADRVKAAEISGKIRHMEKIEKAESWQASAWFLERRYPAEFRRRSEVTGADGAPLQVTATIDVSKISTEALAEIMAAKDAIFD